MRWILAMVMTVWFWLPGQAQAMTVTGQTEPAFLAAVADWLDGNEEAALPQLSELARDGNPAAQILLALIDTTPGYQGAWLAALPRDARVRLLRQRGGISGRNWMHAAARTEPLAVAWIALWQGDAPMSVMTDFAAMGEARAARVAAMTLALRYRKGFAALAEGPDFPASARAFAIREWQVTDPDRARREIDALDAGDPQRAVLGRFAPKAADLADWLTGDPGSGPLRALCATHCPDAIATCLPAAHTAIGGYWEVTPLGTPSDSLIGADEFAASRKGMETVINRLPKLRPSSHAAAQKTTDTGSQCLDALIASMAR